MNGLRLARDLILPADAAATQTYAIIARKGAGKTYTAAVLVEEMVKARQPVVALDPMGAFWGLRVGQDGEREGLPVTILGGEHGDLPLEPTAGKVVAELVVDHPGYYVLDLSLFESKAADERFAADFGETLYRLKAPASKRDPVLLVVDEADMFAPQGSIKGKERMLGAYEAIVRRGRIRGIGCVMVSQRPAVLNKNVLTQAEVLITLQITGPQDRKAIEAWVEGNGTKEEAAVMLGSLAALDTGEAWVWSPSWLRTFQRVRIRERETFDSSKTPEPGARPVDPKRLAPVEVEALRQRMADSVQRARENDPKELQRLLREARAQIAKLEARPSPRPEVQRIEVPVPVEVVPGRLRNALARLRGNMDAETALLDKAVERAREGLGKSVDAALALVDTLPQPAAAKAAPDRITAQPAPMRPAEPPAPRPARAYPSQDGVTGTEQKVLDALAWLRVVTGIPADRIQVAMIAGYHPRTKAFTNALGSLHTAGRIEYPVPGTVYLTNDGAALAHFPPDQPTDEELRALIYAQVGPARTRILEALLSVDGAVSRENLAETLGYHPRTKAFTNNLGSLRTLGLIEYPAAGQVRASSLMYLGTT